jgi:acyl-CoA synthetase (AMP-forming)/AMP-acid ligase II
MQGYYKNPEITAQTIDEQGRLYTGDLGFLDEHGCLTYAGRSKEMVKVGGENVAPSEVEAVLAEIPEVDEAAVVGFPDEKYGEVPVAFLRSTGSRLPEEEVIGLVKSRIASFKVPRRVIWVDEFPRTATGKVRKTELRDREIAARETVATGEAGPA